VEVWECGSLGDEVSTLRQIGEREVIQRLSKLLGSRDDVVVGIGDDVAVVRVEGTHTNFLLTSDAVIEGTHFTSETDAERVGRKAIGRVLSDFASVGGDPLWAIIDLVAPAETGVQKLESIYRGAAELAEKYGMAIVGGDTSSGPVLELHVFGVGQVPQSSAVLRSGARAGDVVYVTGELGGSGAGRHLDFEPRIQEGLWLREAGWANAMIDVSDGLAVDLRHIVDGSGVGAEIDAEHVPVSEAATKGPGDALERALQDGEDFELLFTIPESRRKAFESSWADTFELRCSAIGRITDRAGELVLLRDGERMLIEGGYEHFRSG